MTIEIRPFAVIDTDAVVALCYLASAPERRSEGIGRRLVSRAEDLLREMGCPKVQLMVRPENGGVHDFYAALGYEPFEIWTTAKRLIAD